MTDIAVKYGSGHKCRICGHSIMPTQIEILVKGYHVSAIVHSDINDCDIVKRTYIETK